MSAEPGSRRLAAILAADVVGYSRLIGADEPGTLAKLAALRSDVIDPQMATHGGRVFKTTGDGLLAEFASGVQAVQCAIAIQQAMRAQEGVELRIGLHSADVMVQPDGDLLGDGVNVAARLEAIAEPGGICISGRVREDATGKIALDVEDIGTPELKNIAQRHRVFRVRLDAPERPALPLPDKPSIAVLPFANMSGDPEQEYFADGVVEDIITALSRIRWLFVIARNSSFVYKGRAIDIKQVARELGVRYVLEGSVRKGGSRVRVTTQLIDVSSGAHVWAERYDRDLSDIFAVQDEITASVAGVIEPALAEAERQRVLRKPPEHLDAWELYQRGMWHLLRRNRNDFETARTFFHRAISLDPSFAAPHAALAVSWFWHISHGYTDDATATRLRLYDEASMAVVLDQGDSLAHSALGLAFMERREYAKSISEHQIALSLSPNSSFAHWCIGYALLHAGRSAEAVEHFDTAIRLSPRDPARWSFLTLKAAALYQVERYDEAAQYAEQAARYPVADLVWPLVHRAASLGQLGRTEEAREAVEELRRCRPYLTVSGFLAWPANHSETRSGPERTAEGLRKAGLPE